MNALQTYPGQQSSSILFKLSEFRVEIWLGLTLVVYVIVSYLGRRANTYVARNVMSAVAPALREEFAGVGFNDHLFVLDGGDSVKSYATGRRAFDRAWIQVKLPSRQDPLVYLNHLRAIFDHSYQPKMDRFTLECELSEPSGSFCFAILDRRVLRTTRERWDMLTFTCVSEHTNVDPSLIVLTESGDINSALLRDPANNVLGNFFAPGSQSLQYFESLVITDSGGSAPGDIAFRLPDKNLRIELALRLPPTSHLQKLASWVNLVCDLGDLLHSKQNLVPKLAVTKGKARRAGVIKQIHDLAEQETMNESRNQKEELAAQKRRLKQTKTEAKLASMSKSERIKQLVKEQEITRKKSALKLAKSKHGTK